MSPQPWWIIVPPVVALVVLTCTMFYVWGWNRGYNKGREWRYK